MWSRRRRQRKLARIRSFLWPRWAVLSFVSFAAIACVEEPASIKVKGPRDAVESTQAVPTFAPFEKKNDSIKLRASAFDDRGVFMGSAKVTWDSSDRSVASINQTGVVTILGSGETTIKATTKGYKKELSATLPIKAVIVDKIRWGDPKPEGEDGGPLKMPIGEIKNFKAEVLNDRGDVIEDAKVEWNASSWAVTVTPAGEVEARAIGNATLSAQAKNGETVRVDIEVLDWAKPKRKRRRK